MKRVLTAAVLIPLVLLAVFRAPLWLFALLVAGIIVLGLREYLAIAEAGGIKPFKRLTYAVGLLPILIFIIFRLIDRFSSGERGYALYPHDYPLLRALGILSILAPVIMGIPLVFRRELRSGLAAAAVSVFGGLYIAWSMALLIALRSNPAQSVLIVLVLFSVWAGDIAAYYVGRSVGRHKLAPVVSPNKSWEGAIASIFASIAVAFTVLHFTPQVSRCFVLDKMYASPSLTLVFPEPSRWHALILGIVTNAAAQFGDLFESALKRGSGVKDSGTLLPGHGGVLDRMDAMFFAVPVVWYYAQLTAATFLTAKSAP
jgi:phosphatidate cytidylyltransferase